MSLALLAMLTTGAVLCGQITKHAAELTAEDPATRAAAQLKLVEAGSPVLPQLGRELLRQGDRSAPAAAFAEVERKIAQRLLRGRVIQLTRRTTRSTLSAALEKLAEESGNPIELRLIGEESTRTVVLDAEPSLFWTLLRRLCAQGRVGWNWSEEGQLVVSAEDRLPEETAETVNCFRVEASQRVRNVILEPGQPRLPIRMNLHVDVEPRVEPFYVTTRVQNVACLIGETALKPFSPDASVDLPFRFQAVDVPIDFVLPDDLKLDRPARIQGVLIVCSAAERVKLNFSLTGGDNPPQWAGRTQVELLDFERTPTESAITLRATWPPDRTWESFRLAMLYRQIGCEDEAGARVPLKNAEIIETAGHVHTIRCELKDPAAQPVRLIYDVPTLITEEPVKFDLSGIAVRE